MSEAAKLVKITRFEPETPAAPGAEVVLNNMGSSATGEVEEGDGPQAKLRLIARLGGFSGDWFNGR